MRNDRQDGSEGRLPASAPLANPYVPFQLENPPKYEARKGLVQGTLFPGLDLPFMRIVTFAPYFVNHTAGVYTTAAAGSPGASPECR